MSDDPRAWIAKAEDTASSARSNLIIGQDLLNIAYHDAPNAYNALTAVLNVADEPAPMWFTADQAYTYDAAMDHIRDTIADHLKDTK